MAKSNNTKTYRLNQNELIDKKKENRDHSSSDIL